MSPQHLYLHNEHHDQEHDFHVLLRFYTKQNLQIWFLLSLVLKPIIFDTPHLLKVENLTYLSVFFNILSSNSFHVRLLKQ